MPRRVVAGLFLLPLLLPSSWADTPAPRAARVAELRRQLDPVGIEGALVIHGGGKLPEPVIARFLELAGGEQARLVVIPTASETADKEPAEKQLAFWKDRKIADVTLLHTRAKERANDLKFLEPLTKATGVWIGGGDQKRLAEAFVGTAVEKELHALLKRGGVIGGTSAGAAVMSRLMIAGGNPNAETARGFDLLPGAVIDQHFLKRERKTRLAGVLERNSGLVGLGIDEETALVVKGRSLRVLGDSTVTACLTASETRPARTIELKAGQEHDLTALRRAAIARAESAFPPKEFRAAEVKSGALVIVGGGGMPREVTQKFIDLAGGPDALIVVLPTANPDPLPDGVGEGGFFQRAGAKNVKTLRARRKADVEAPENLEILKQAKAIWFGGGRQWRFVDAYEGTKAEPLIHDVLARGGVIGGSSAGATIQGEYLVRGSPLGNFEMMSEGYERGFGYLPGVAIDQHFSQRKRFGDMSGVVKRFPQVVGLGIDEATALVVQGHIGEVMGRGKVHVFDAQKQRAPEQPDYDAASAGDRYDFKERKVIPK